MRQRSRLWSRVWVLPAAVAVGVLVGVALAALSPATAAGSRYLRTWTTVDSWPTVLVLGASLGCAFWLFWWPRRGQARPFALVFGLAVGLAALGLGVSAYLPCDATGTPGVSAVAWTLSLFVGTVENVWSRNACAAPRPLAIEVARFAALVATFTGFAAVLLAATGQQWDRLRVRLAGSTVVVAGLDEGGLTLAAALEGKHPDGTLAVVEPDQDSSLLSRARAAGARVVAGDLAAAPVAKAVLTRRGSLSALAVYLLDPDPGVNLRVLTTVEAVLKEVTDTRPTQALRPDGKVPRLTVRIDDPWQVEDWRRQNFVTRKGVGVDAISIYETTAQLVLDQAVRRSEDRLMIVGTSPLAFALLTELAQRWRERHALAGAFGLPEGAAARPVPAEVLVLSQDASELVTDHRLQQERFGNGAAIGRIHAVDSLDPAAELARRLKNSDDWRVIVASSPSPASLQLASRIAARHERHVLYCWTDQVTGLSRTPLRAQLYGFGLAFAADGHVPDGRWDRVARMLHEGYRKKYAPTGVSGLPWDASDAGPEGALGNLYRQSNLRQIRTVMDEVQQRGCTWGPIPCGTVSEAETDFTQKEIEKIARAEHRSWYRYLKQQGWRCGERDEKKERHPLLRDWDTLEAQQAKAIAGVKETLRLLHLLGYRPVRELPAGEAASAWRRFRRSGSVSATQLARTHPWTSDAGDLLTGQPGDWLVQDGDRTWTVRDAEFRSSHRSVGAAYERKGEVRARPGCPGEVVDTLEGPVTVREGDWVVEGERGETWPVPAERFTAAYVPVDPA